MLNKAPIFVNGFQRGGTNILMQLISSHPRVGILGAEVHELFYGRDTEPIKKWFRRLAAVPVVLNAREHTFWAYRFQKRRSLAPLTLRYIDLLFYLNKRLVYNSHYQNGAVTRTRPEREGTRIVGKCVNLPLTGKGVVDMLITDLAVFHIDSKLGATLIELAPGVTVEEIKAKSAAPFTISGQLKAA